MPQTLPNGIKTPINSEAYNLTGDLAAMGNSTNVPVAVANAAARDALTKTVGLTVYRQDQSMQRETWDGAKWVSVPHIEFTYNVGAGGIPNASIWGPGAFTLDSGTVSTDTALATPAASDQITIAKAGTYAIWFGGAFGAGVSGNSWFQIKAGDDSTVIASAPAVEFWGSVSLPAYRITSDATTLRFRLKQTSGGSTSGTGRARITRIG